MKLYTLVGADSQEGSLVMRLSGSVVMRNVVIRQMKKPTLNRTTKPIQELKNMLRRITKGMGRTKMAMSVRRLRMAFDQLWKLPGCTFSFCPNRLRPVFE